MGWSDAIFDSLTLPNTAGPGQARIVIGSALPPPLNNYLVNGTQKFVGGITLYAGTAGDDDYLFLGLVVFPTAIYFKIIAVQNGAVLESGPGGPWALGLNFNAAGEVAIEISGDTVSGQNSAWSTLLAIDPAAGNIQESWHSVTFAGSWINDPGAFTSPMQYRKNVLNRVELNGIVRSPNPFTATIFTLPASYRPNTPQGMWAWTNAGISTILRIDTNGDVVALGNTAVTTTWWIQGSFPLQK